ncbi:MAG: GNAT family N-acetyltransferase [Acidimicrobiia bacterium]
MDDIVEITAAETHDLRRRILRAGTPSDVVTWDGDDESTTFHLGARSAEGELVAISTWLLRRYPDRPAEEAFQLRGMATDPARRGSGVSARLLLAGLDRCTAAGATLVWARARVPALSFYERHGFSPIGPEYTDLTTGLRHRDILRPL